VTEHEDIPPLFKVFEEPSINDLIPMVKAAEVSPQLWKVNCPGHVLYKVHIPDW
jgi:hypothetical protein